VPHILVGVCDACDAVVSVPQQSFAAVGEVKRKEKKGTQDFRVPRHLLDVLNNAIADLGVEISSDLRGVLLRYYIAAISESASSINKLKHNLESELLQGHFGRGDRISIKFGSQIEECFEEIKLALGFSKTQVIDSIIVEVKKDLLDSKNSKRSVEVKRALLAG
jgi:hypothetical protein